MYTGIERRLFSRIEGKLPVKYREEGTQKQHLASSKNISGSGIRISLSKNVKKGAILDMKIFENEVDEGISCRGEIVWVSNNEAGIKFIDSDLMYIGRLMKNLATQTTTLPRN